MPLSVDYLNFDILITRFGDEYHVFVVDAPGGDADAPLVLPFTPGDIDALPLTGKTRRTRSRRKMAAPPNHPATRKPSPAWAPSCTTPSSMTTCAAS